MKHDKAHILNKLWGLNLSNVNNRINKQDVRCTYHLKCIPNKDDWVAIHLLFWAAKIGADNSTADNRKTSVLCTLCR